MAMYWWISIAILVYQMVNQQALVLQWSEVQGSTASTWITFWRDMFTEWKFFLWFNYLVFLHPLLGQYLGCSASRLATAQCNLSSVKQWWHTIGMEAARWQPWQTPFLLWKITSFANIHWNMWDNLYHCQFVIDEWRRMSIVMDHFHKLHLEKWQVTNPPLCLSRHCPGSSFQAHFGWNGWWCRQSHETWVINPSGNKWSLSVHNLVFVAEMNAYSVYIHMTGVVAINYVW